MTVASIRPLPAALIDLPDSRVFDPTASDSEAVLEHASVQGLTFLLQGVPGLPTAVQERVRQECLNITARNMALAGELRVLLRAFRDQGIQCLPLRGLALAERLYGSGPPRPMGDIDLLVRKDDLPRVQVLFRDLGFYEMDRRQGFAAAFSYTLKFFVERSFMVIVEPHWTIAYPPFVDRVDMEAVWGRCVAARVVGEETLSLGREDLMVHLCLHLTHRDDAPFLWLYELDRFLRQESEALTWDLVVSVAREAGVEQLIGRALNQAVAKLRTPVPADVLDALSQQDPRCARPLAERLALTSTVDGVESLATFFAIKGLGAKFRYTRALLFPVPAFMMLQYGLTHRRQLAPAYLRRFFWLLWQAATGVVHLCLGGTR